MTQLETTTGEVIARAILSHAEAGAFGVLVKDMPEFEPTALLAALRPGLGLRVAMPGYSPTVTKSLKDAARRAGFSEGTFVTTVEGAERWRNDARISDTIVVVAPREIPKLNSLNRFQTLSADELYKQVCREGLERLGVNEAQKQLWRALSHKQVTRAIPLEGLLTYFGELEQALSKSGEEVLPTHSRELLYLLGLLPDQDLFTSPTAAKIAQRLLENQRVVDQLEVLSRADRQRISKALATRADTPAGAKLQETYQRAMLFYREQDPSRLKDLWLRDVQDLLRAKPTAPTNDEPSPAPEGGHEPRAEKPEKSPTVRALDMILDDNEEGLTQLADTVRRAMNADPDDDDADARDPETGASLEVSRSHPFLRLVERYVTASHFGGFIDSPAATLDEALALLDKAQFRPFDPSNGDWALRQTLADLVADTELDGALLRNFDAFIEARTVLARDVRELLLEPLIALNTSKKTFATAESYLAAYKALTEGLKQAYEAIAQIAPEGVEVLCSQVLALDSIVFRTSTGFKAVLSPLHPLHLWKFIELSRQLRVQAGALTSAERGLLRDAVQDLPNFVTTLYVSNYVTNAGPRVLPEAGVRGGLPFFEELAHQYAGRDGVPEIARLLEKFCVLHPHARLGLRVALVDPPDIDFVLREVVKLTESSPLDLGGVHLRLFFTQRVGTAVAALGGGAEDEEGAERFRGIGSSSRYTLEVHDRPLTIGGIGGQLREHPAHVVVYFDPSSAKTHRFARTPSLSVHPLCLPMQFSYDRITKTVRVVPASDGGVFSDHNDLRNRLSHQLTGSFFGVTAELKSEQKDLAKLAEGCSWLVIADRAQEGVLTFGVPRVSLKRSAKRDVAVYAKDVQKFVAEFDRQLRRCNYTPTPKSVEQLIGDLGSLLSDGLLALVSQGAPTALDEKRTQGLVGTLVTSAWYRQKHQRSLVVSIDSPDARRWLELRDEGSRADLFGIVDEDDGSCTLDIIEVKTYSQPEDAYRVSGGEISGDAVDQLLNTCRIVEEIFQLDETGRRLVAPQRREVLRQQLFRECFFEGRSEAEKQLWSKKLNDVFGLDVKVKIRLSLVVVGLTQARGSSERVLRSATRDVRLVELTEDEVRRHVTGGTPPGGTPPSGTPPTQPPTGGGGGSRGARIAPPAPTTGVQLREREEEEPAAPPTGAASRRTPDAESGRTPTAQIASAVSSTLGAEERLLIEKQAADLRRILKDHGVPVQELDPEKAQVGPSVIRYRARLRAGAKLSSLRSRAEDIGRELASRTTPFIDNISGETYVGIDLERPHRQTMSLLPAIAALPAPKGLELPVAVGVSPSGEHVVLDIVQLPHLLVAGSTMSGKTVFLHAILLSLIARLSPEQLELLIIDPKATDFVLYNGLPYLRGGRVFTEAEDAVEQLRQLTDEELRERTRVLQQARCPNLSEYNAANPGRALKPIVVVIDEYADLMAVLPKKERQDFEREINRLAQRARSVGIHLVLATQRPTADIVTGLLKANMPCRVTFRLPQRVDSQTILDQTGAENLFGRGDMLLLQNDRLSRLQGFYMSPTEMTEFLADRYPGSGVAPIDEEPEDEELDLSVDDRDNANHKDLIGEVTGLAVGPDREDLLDGDVMTIEVGVKPGDGAEVTGRSGDVLKQSVLAAWRHVQQYAADYGIPEEKLRDHGVSVHLVNISEYREGPSAGMPFVVAMVSALSNRPVRRAVAMSGEVSLKGKVSAVGGVPQKVVAAYKRGRKVVILPKANARDLERVPREILDALDIRLVSTASEALKAALND